MRKLALYLLINGACVYAVVQFLANDVQASGGFKLYLVAAIIIGILNALIKPLIRILSFPLIFITGGLFLIVINAIILWFLHYALNILAFEGVAFEILGLKGYLYAAIIFGLTNWFLQWIFKLRR